MPKISRFADLRDVFLPSEAGYQSPAGFADVVVLTQDWAGGGLALGPPANNYKSAAPVFGAAPSSVQLWTVPVGECWRIINVSLFPVVGTPTVYLYLRMPAYTVQHAFTNAVTAPATAYDVAFQLYGPIVVEPGTVIGATSQAGALNNSVQVNLHCIVAPAGLGFRF